jgi:hypothetical protein
MRSHIIVVSAIQNGAKMTAATFQAGLIPEFSICERRLELEEQPAPLDAEGNEVLSVGFVPQARKDALKKGLEEIFNNPARQYNETEAITLLEQASADTPMDKPYMQKVARVGRELVRGWRTVLALLVRQGLIRVVDVERLVGAADRQTWAVKIGRRREVCLV